MTDISVEVDLDVRQVLAVRGLTVQIAPPAVASRVLLPHHHNSPVYLVVANGTRLSGRGAAIGLLATGAQLGRMAGLAAARTAEAGGAAQFVAAKDQAGQAARETPAEAEVSQGPPVTHRQATEQMVADVDARRTAVADLVAGIRQATAAGTAGDELWRVYGDLGVAAQTDPLWLATLAVAALRMLAESDPPDAGRRS